jgi:hypothetical protein
MHGTYHYPPELMNLLIDAIPALCRGKKGVLLFFRGAGVSPELLADLEALVSTNKEAVSKSSLAETVLVRLNERGDATLRERREVLKRIVEWEDFSTCWPADELKAKGLVSEIRRVVNVKDSFTRMRSEREEERKKRLAEQQAKVDADNRKRTDLANVRRGLSALFSERDPHRRGKALEGVLHRLFQASGISIREPFALCGVRPKERWSR